MQKTNPASQLFWGDRDCRTSEGTVLQLRYAAAHQNILILFSTGKDKIKYFFFGS